MTEKPRPEFRRLLFEMVGRTDEDIDLARAALFVAGEKYQDLDVDRYLGTLDSLAEGARRYTRQELELRGTIERLGEFLFVKEEFRGNEEDYYDPRNSYFNDVLDRRLGIPITLSLLYMEVARRLGIIFEGIGLPGHFVIRTGPPEQELYVDVFNGGGLLSRRECESIVENLTHRREDGRFEFREEYLLPYTKKQFLIRLLTNLKHSYVRIVDYEGAIPPADLIALIEPALGSNLRERAWFYYNLKEYRMALKDLEAYLRIAPQAEDAERVRKHIKALRSALENLN